MGCERSGTSFAIPRGFSAQPTQFRQLSARRRLLLLAVAPVVLVAEFELAARGFLLHPLHGISVALEVFEAVDAALLSEVPVDGEHRGLLLVVVLLDVFDLL